MPILIRIILYPDGFGLESTCLYFVQYRFILLPIVLLHRFNVSFNCYLSCIVLYCQIYYYLVVKSDILCRLIWCGRIVTLFAGAWHYKTKENNTMYLNVIYIKTIQYI